MPTIQGHLGLGVVRVVVRVVVREAVDSESDWGIR